jgi:glutamyl-tRNA(Gln) amidotransferase subunit D
VSIPSKVIILTTGGTIGHRTQGGVALMDFEPSTLASNLGLDGLTVEFVPVFAKGSMNIVPDDWTTLANTLYEQAQRAPRGIVILHGTDTMHYTAAALSFMLRGLCFPVVLTGSMRPGGDPDSDAIANLGDSIRVAATADIAEVCIVFSADAARSQALIIRGTRARKVHSWALNAFASINAAPIGFVRDDTITMVSAARQRGSETLRLSGGFAPGVPLVKLTPAVTADALAQCLRDAPGAVFEGTGIGHIRSDLQPVVASFGKPVVMTTQAVYGGERLGMYDADRAILSIPNVIPVRDMSSETALVKLMWALTQEEDVRTIMRSNIVGEIYEDESSSPDMGSD